ncbi:MAG: hypothetical protein N2Z82_09285 [Thermomicrobium sp.]|nr:hypothetical protein [Thermomicrobium sp.]
MLKMPLLRSEVVYVAPEALEGIRGVWLGRQHLAAWWRGDGPWPTGSFPCLGTVDDWFIVERVRPSKSTRLYGRERRPTGLRLRGVATEFALPFRARARVRPAPEASSELLFAAGEPIATLESESFYEAARRAIQARGGRQARGVFLTLAPGVDGVLARFGTRGGTLETVPVRGELHVTEPVAIPAALPRWLWWAGCRDDRYRVTRPPIGGWAAWWGDPALGLVMRAWIDDRGTVVQRRRRE